MNRSGKIVLISAAAAAAAYGIASAYRQLKLVQDTDFQPISVQKKLLTFKKIILELSAQIGNKSDISFEIYSQDYDVYINDIFVGKVVNNQTVRIPKKGKGVSNYTIGFDPAKVVRAGFSKNPLDGVMKIKGKLKTKTFGLLFSGIPVDIKIPLKDFIKG